MLCEITDGELNRMSAIIGICGENFCSFVADTRLTHNSGDEYIVANDTTQKIFKVNDHVLFGMTGLFRTGEEILVPLDIYPEKDVVTLRMAYKAVLGYLEKNKYKIPLMRSYLIGGKDNKGRFCIYEVHMNFETYKAETVLRMPEPPVTSYGIFCAIPPELHDRKNEFLDMAGDCITSSGELGEMLQKVAGVIGKIADADGTVGRTITALSVF